MRRPRVIAPQSHQKAYYHCVSRIVNRDFVLGEVETKVENCPQPETSSGRVGAFAIW